MSDSPPPNATRAEIDAFLREQRIGARQTYTRNPDGTVTIDGPLEAILDDLIAAAKRIEARGPEAVEAAARKSALYTIRRNPGCDVSTICAEQGLWPEYAQKAVAQLLAMGAVRRGRLGGLEAMASS